MTNDEMIASALGEMLEKEIAECDKLPDHKFSHRFNRKMKNLLQSCAVDNSHTSRLHIGKRMLVAIIAIGSLLLLMGAAATTYVLWNNFHMQDLSLYTLLNISDVEDCPNTLEERYELTADLGGFTENVLSDDEYLYFVEYKSEEKNINISFMQQTKQGITQALNTEDSAPPIEVVVNDCKGIYYETRYGSRMLIWDTGDYLINLGTKGISKDELFSLAKTVQKVE